MSFTTGGRLFAIDFLEIISRRGALDLTRPLLSYKIYNSAAFLFIEMARTIAIAKHDFVGQSETELTFQAGARITVITEREPGDWWKGEIGVDFVRNDHHLSRKARGGALRGGGGSGGGTGATSSGTGTGGVAGTGASDGAPSGGRGGHLAGAGGHVNRHPFLLGKHLCGGDELVALQAATAVGV